MYISAENILIISVLINALLGAILGLCFRVPVLVLLSPSPFSRRHF